MNSAHKTGDPCPAHDLALVEALRRGGNQRVQLHRARARVKHELERYFSDTALKAPPAA